MSSDDPLMHAPHCGGLAKSTREHSKQRQSNGNHGTLTSPERNAKFSGGGEPNGRHFSQAPKDSLPPYSAILKCLKDEISLAPQLRLSPWKAICFPLMR